MADLPFYDEPDTMLLCPYRGWHMWRGVCGLVYARRLKTSPSVVFRAGGERAEQDVLDQIEGWLDEHPGQRSVPVDPWPWADAEQALPGGASGG